MKQELDFQIIRNSIIVFILILTFGLTAIYSSDSFRKNMEQINRDEQQKLSQIKSKYSTALSEIQMLKKYLPQYDNLKKLGFLGEENRLNWIEALRRTATKYHFETVNYNISPQQKFKTKQKLPRGRFKLHSSDMSLRFNAMHEIDIINLIEGLKKESVGLFSPQMCRLERIREQLNYFVGSANFIIECKLNWFTARIKKNK